MLEPKIAVEGIVFNDLNEHIEWKLQFRSTIAEVLDHELKKMHIRRMRIVEWYSFEAGRSSVVLIYLWRNLNEEADVFILSDKNCAIKFFRKSIPSDFEPYAASPCVVDVEYSILNSMVIITDFLHPEGCLIDFISLV